MSEPLLHRLIERLYRNKLLVKAARGSEVVEFLRKLAPVDAGVPLERLGPASDGGYLVPRDLEGIAACVSPGVSFECGFDFAVAEKGIPVYMADASVDGPALEHPKFHFLKKFIDITPSDTTITLEQFCESIPECASGGDLMLQMDIEGAEYRVLLSTPDAVLRRFRIMVVEFHDLERLLERFSCQFIHATFLRLLEHFYVVHIHPNNAGRIARRRGLHIPTITEFSFLRKDRVAGVLGKAIRLPHPLDTDNMPGWPPIALPPCWRGSP